MRNAYRFNKYFGLRWYDRFNDTLVSIFIVVALIFIAAILIVANLNYQKLKYTAEQNIRARYIELVSEVLIERPEERTSYFPDQFAELVKPEPKPRLPKSTPESRRAEREKAQASIENEPVFNTNTIRHNYDYLPEVELSESGVSGLELEMLTRNPVDNPGRAQNVHFNNSNNGDNVDNLDPGEYDEPLRHPFNYVAEKRGTIYIDFTEELLQQTEDNTKFVYRDPDEINRVIKDYYPMVEYCFKKEARYHSTLQGFIKVQFNISPEGHVLPESIKIINSTINNKNVENCLKNFIKHWRNFGKLDKSRGIARVVQKFVFN